MDTEASLTISKDTLKTLEGVSTHNAHRRTNKRSLSVAEVIRCPHDLEHPIPIALKVKNAGKEFLLHDRTCQWIKFMHNHEFVPQRNTREVRPVRLDPGAQDKLEKRDLLKELTQAQQAAAFAYDEKLKTLLKQQEELAERQCRLEEQLEQQLKMQELLSLQQIKPDNSESDEMKELSQTRQNSQHSKLTGPLPGLRRRLKGNVAQFCAERSEGSVGSLMYYMDPQSFQGDAVPFTYGDKSRNKSVFSEESQGPNASSDGPSCAVMFSASGETPTIHKETSPVRPILMANIQGTSPAAVGRQKAMSQESGFAVCQLLHQPTRQNYEELIKSNQNTHI